MSTFPSASADPFIRTSGRLWVHGGVRIRDKAALAGDVVESSSIELTSKTIILLTIAMGSSVSRQATSKTGHNRAFSFFEGFERASSSIDVL